MDEEEKTYFFKETFEEFLGCLQEHEIATHSKFVVTDSCKQFTVSKGKIVVFTRFEVG